MDTDKEPVIYQLRVVLESVSPLIWRRLLVPGDYSIADLGVEGGKEQKATLRV